MIDTPLSPVEIRIVGSLMEKEITTPDAYPLTLNALVTACNQSTNRDPVLSLDEETVNAGLAELATRQFVRQVFKSESRAKRYRQTMSETLHLHPAEAAVMCVLMLRGPQTAGEIRTRSARLFEFRDVPHVDVTLQSLMTLTTPLVVQLARRPGQKELRYAHLLGGQPADDHTDEAAQMHETSTPRVDRIAQLEEDVASLRTELAELKARFEEFVRSF
jgi:uncharacterized protein YceH (UPF0502 family)